MINCLIFVKLFLRKVNLSRLKKWDQKVLTLGNGVKWLNLARYRGRDIKTQGGVLNAWGRKINLLWLGQWKGSNAY